MRPYVELRAKTLEAMLDNFSCMENHVEPAFIAGQRSMAYAILVDALGLKADTAMHFLDNKKAGNR